VLLRVPGAGTPAVAVVSGRAGVGKTGLAVHVAHSVSDRFPEGQVYADLRGASGDALSPHLVLGRFLRALGVPGGEVPRDRDERVALYRSLVADSALLVVLDDAADEGQIRPLLPASATCSVLITSRTALTGLEGAALLGVDVLPLGESIEMLAGIAGFARVSAEPDAAEAIVDYCGALPLAVRIAGARLAARPAWQLSELAGRLADEHGRLDHLAAGDLEVRASLALSYRGLDAEHRRMFRLLGQVTGGADFPGWLAGPVAGVSGDLADTLVEDLACAHLLDRAADLPSGPRYRFHDLVRLYARERAVAEDTAAALRAALGRAVSGWLTVADLADDLLPTTSDAFGPGEAPHWTLPDELLATLLTDPVRWFDLELRNLSDAAHAAADADLAEAAWELMCRLSSYLHLHVDLEVWYGIVETVLAACRRAGNERGTAAALAYAGVTVTRAPGHRGSLADGRRMLAEAVRIFRRLGDRRDEARGAVHQASALVLSGVLTGSDELVAQSIRCARRAVELADLVSDEAIAAEALLAMARAHGGLGQWSEMLAAAERPYRFALATGARQVQAASLHYQATADRHLGRPEAARRRLEEALRVAEILGDVRGRTEVLMERGRLEAAAGNMDAAIALLDHAKALRSPVERQFQLRVDLEIGSLCLRADRPAAAVHYLTSAVTGAAALGGGALHERSLALLDEALAAAGRDGRPLPA
jgi:tetratricopeptide (TPR) repeat protein